MVAAPFSALSPAAVLDALDAVGFRGDGRVLQLNSYENRVFQVHLETEHHEAPARVVVAKFYRPARWRDEQILEEHHFALELAQADVPVVPPLPLGTNRDVIEAKLIAPTLAQVNLDGDFHRVALSERRAGRAANLEDMQVLQWLGRYLGRLHNVGARERFLLRRTLNVETFGDASRQRIAALRDLDEASQSSWLAASDLALRCVREAFERIGSITTLRLHGDFHPGNVLWREGSGEDDIGGPHIVDLDDACNGPAIQDLWMLLSSEPTQQQRELQALLDGYEMFRDFDRRELALIEPLRTLRMIHHSAWIAERWSDPAFPIAFPWFDTPGYWAQQTMQLREQIEAMQNAPE